MFKLLNLALLAIINLLPSSPFQTNLDGTIEKLDFLPYLNWFIPFDNCVKILNLWLISIIAYYIYSFVKQPLKELFIDKIFGK